jgi:hypothetical protein
MAEITGSGPWPDHTAAGSHRRAHDAVRRLRERLTELGLPDDQIRQIVPISDWGGRTHVRLGTVTVDTAEKLLDALDVAAAASMKPSA